MKNTADRLIFSLLLLLPIIFVLSLSNYFYDPSLVAGPAFPTDVEAISWWLKLFWYTGLLFAGTCLVGFIMFGSPEPDNNKAVENLNDTGWNNKNKLVVTYVSRGTNPEALVRAIRKTQDVLTSNGVKFDIEVVTDINIKRKMPRKFIVHYYNVPTEFSTINKAKYKARALEYLNIERKKRLYKQRNVWILHLDEESTITNKTIAGIHEFISKKGNSKKIGQGEILYNAHNYGNHLLITVMDSLRTGDDLGRFRVQYKIFNKPLFGMHGSYILVPRSIEQKLGFDLSPKGSITEDAYFALVASGRGVKFGWVNGPIHEQSPFTIKDIMKQRRRWINGLMLLAFDKGIYRKTRVVLVINMVMWNLAWLGTLALIVDLIVQGGEFNPILLTSVGFITGIMLATYLLGAYRNVISAEVRLLKKLQVILLTVPLAPIAAMVEGASVLFALTRPISDFEIVSK